MKTNILNNLAGLYPTNRIDDKTELILIGDSAEFVERFLSQDIKSGDVITRIVGEWDIFQDSTHTLTYNNESMVWKLKER